MPQTVHAHNDIAATHQEVVIQTRLVTIYSIAYKYLYHNRTQQCYCAIKDSNNNVTNTYGLNNNTPMV